MTQLTASYAGTEYDVRPHIPTRYEQHSRAPPTPPHYPSGDSPAYNARQFDPRRSDYSSEPARYDERYSQRYDERYGVPFPPPPSEQPAEDMQLSLYTGREAVNPVPYSTQPRRSYTDSVINNPRVDHGQHRYERPHSRASVRTVYPDPERHQSDLPEVYHPSPETSRFDRLPASPNLHHSWMPTVDNRSEYDPPAFQPQTTARDCGHQQDDRRSVDRYREKRETSPHSEELHSPMRHDSKPPSRSPSRSSSPVFVNRRDYSRSPSRESYRSAYTEKGYRGPSFDKIVTERRRVPSSDSSEDSYDRRNRRNSGTRSGSPRALRTDYRVADDSWYSRRPRSQTQGSKPQGTSAIIIISGTNLVADLMEDLFSK